MVSRSKDVPACAGEKDRCLREFDMDESWTTVTPLERCRATEDRAMPSVGLSLDLPGPLHRTAVVFGFAAISLSNGFELAHHAVVNLPLLLAAKRTPLDVRWPPTGA